MAGMQRDRNEKFSEWRGHVPRGGVDCLNSEAMIGLTASVHSKIAAIDPLTLYD